LAALTTRAVKLEPKFQAPATASKTFWLRIHSLHQRQNIPSHQGFFSVSRPKFFYMTEKN